MSPKKEGKNKGKASVKISAIAPGQNTLHVGAVHSYCAIRLFGRPDHPRFQHAQLQRSEERVQRVIMKCSGAETNPTVAGGSTNNSGGLGHQIKQTDASELGLREC